MSDYTDRTIAAERESHFDGDRWRSYCGESIRGPGPITPRAPLPPRACACLQPATTGRYFGGAARDLCEPCAARLDQLYGVNQ